MRLRYVARPVPLLGRRDNWRVYDTEMASFPYDRPDTGHVQQDVTKAEAEAEAARLNGVPLASSEWDVAF